jgi:alginate O-acetyltransferase complex protein AlgI
MVFSSFTYVFFLLAVVLLYWKLPSRFRVLLLLIASYVFYMSWNPPYGLIYGPVIFLDSLYFYVLSLGMVRWPHYKKNILIFGITTELLLLGYFKYMNFLAHTMEWLLTIAHLPATHIELSIFLPLAISFTNFILISYLVDVYRGDETPDPSFIRFATYVAFFPHLIAGPIVRAKELLHQIDNNPSFDISLFVQGIHKFLLGLTLKVFVADIVGLYVNLIYSDPSLQGFDTSWVATYSFAIQIFCDFAGYTLMAQGSALMLGYTLPENFSAPYFAQNISDFWHRWHMSLSRWLRDYLYIPLGGSRGSRFNTYRNLFITMGLGGLWHGANWTFVVWGLYQGLLLSLHKFADYFKLNRFIPKILAVFITFHAVCIGWVFFRASTFEQAWYILYTMITPATALGKSAVEDMPLTVIFLFLIIHFLAYYFAKHIPKSWIKDTGIGFAYFLLFYLSITMKTATQTFIYFQF